MKQVPGVSPFVAEDPFKGPWLRSRQAQAYVGCKSLKGFYAWRRRHGVPYRSNGTVNKADLDRALLPKKTLRRIHPNSLANLRRRSA